MRFLNTILNVIFPINCISCEIPGFDLCKACLSDFPSAERESVHWIFPIFDYRHPPIKKALWSFKYENKKRLAKIFAEILHGRILEELSELIVMENFRSPILVPIPLSKKRYKERGYNQAELICEELIKLDGGKTFKLEKNILIKPIETEHQARILNRAERLRNIVNSFSVNKEKVEKIKNRNVILIDDITTTGATLSEAKKVLKQYGARKIIAFTVAH